MSWVDEFLESYEAPPEGPVLAPAPPIVEDAIAIAAQHEIVIDKRTGKPRQAGSSHPDGVFILQFRERAEKSLYVFAKGVLGRAYLTSTLHKPLCDSLQVCPPHRKGRLLPREHGKTSIVSHALPMHILIQSPENNPYFPGEDGADQRVYLCGETEQRATDAIRVIQSAFETNDVLRALWPHRVWDNPRRDAKKWNDREMIIPRRQEYPDPSIRGIGVGGAVTGAHPTVLIKDDLVTLEAANSPVVMETAIQWHIASRALINNPRSLEFIIGTRWAINDLYEYIMRTDPTVDWDVRAIVEDGALIYPEAFTFDKVAELQRQFGVLFPLLYMNSAADPELTDFDMEMIRVFEIVGDRAEFREDDRDLTLAERMNAPGGIVNAAPVGAVLNDATWQAIYTPGSGGLRFRS